MKITRYFQSCLLIEDGVSRILIDPSGQDSSRLAEFGQLDAVLYTHEHSDHFDVDLAQQLAANGAKLYANQSTAKQMKSPPAIVEEGQEFEAGGLKIKSIELPHCLMWDGSPGPQNTGYLIAGKLFHPGDGKELENLSVETLAVPIAGPDVSIKDAISFANQVGAKTLIPIHYDYIGTKPEVFASVAGDKFKISILKVAQSLEL